MCQVSHDPGPVRHDWGIRPCRWEELYLVTAWRRFLADPGSYFRQMQVG